MLGLADEQKKDSPTQPTKMIASQVMRAAEQKQAMSPPPTPFPIILSTMTVEKVEEMPMEQQTATPVPNSIIINASQTRHEDTNGHLIARSTKVEDPDIDISNEHIEGGDSDDDLDDSEDSLWQNEVKFPSATIRNVVD